MNKSEPTAVRTLLVADDDRLHNALRRIFDHSNWQLTSAYSIREGLDLLKSSDPFVVLCDRHLPDGDWRDLYEALADARITRPIIVVAEIADEQFWLESLGSGAYDVLEKPLQASEVYRLVSQAWMYSLKNCRALSRMAVQGMAQV